MKIDYVEAFGAKYIAIEPENKLNPFYAKEKMPLIGQISNANKNLYSMLLPLADLVKAHPEYMIKHLKTLDDDYETKIIKNTTLCKLLEPEKIIDLHDRYKRHDELFIKYKEAELAFRKGERKTHPRNEISLNDETEKILGGLHIFDHYNGDIEEEIIRQHLNHPLLYGGEFTPERLNFDDGIFRLAHKDGTDNHGHSGFLFDIYETLESKTIQPDGKKTLFPVTLLELRLITSVSGYGDCKFNDFFYKK